MDKETSRQRIVEEMAREGYRITNTGECDDFFAVTRYGSEVCYEWVEGRWEPFAIETAGSWDHTEVA